MGQCADGQGSCLTRASKSPHKPYSLVLLRLRRFSLMFEIDPFSFFMSLAVYSAHQLRSGAEGIQNRLGDAGIL
jgi:hypothetical protein